MVLVFHTCSNEVTDWARCHAVHGTNCNKPSIEHNCIHRHIALK